MPHVYSNYAKRFVLPEGEYSAYVRQAEGLECFPGDDGFGSVAFAITWATDIHIPGTKRRATALQKISAAPDDPDGVEALMRFVNGR